MDDERPGDATDYFAWTRTGHFDLALGVLIGLLNAIQLVASGAGANRSSIVVNVLFVGLGLALVVRGARRLMTSGRGA